MLSGKRKDKNWQSAFPAFSGGDPSGGPGGDSAVAGGAPGGGPGGPP